MYVGFGDVALCDAALTVVQVTGEIPTYNTLRAGFIAAVVTVGLFYIVIATLYVGMPRRLATAINTDQM